ncbi:MAG: hypothetical protein A2283_19615 [Lentisphaerae bacterium RIFOXYA12_FULL_48_11]|nr:MAG: hypothetical protein A2283_19615 [Lentisphaerae bacterium RIFOXYA12_FULL_48_11]
MRQIGNLPDERSAQIFCDYLYGKSIENEIETLKDGSWTVWVRSDDKLKEAATLLELYRQNPDLPEYHEHTGHAEELRKAKQKEDEEFKKKIYDRNRILSWEAQVGLLSFTLIAINVTLYIMGYFGHRESIIQALSIEQYGESKQSLNMLPEIFAGEIWRLFTPIFLHFGPLHLLFNMLWLKDLGTAIEKRHSSLVLAILIMAIASASNLAQYLVRGPSFGGMSGVVYGLFGYIWMQSRYNISSGFHLDKQIVIMMIAWFVLCLSGLAGPIANTAHGVGLLSGMVIGYIAAFVSTRQPT